MSRLVAFRIFVLSALAPLAAGGQEVIFDHDNSEQVARYLTDDLIEIRAQPGERDRDELMTTLLTLARDGNPIAALELGRHYQTGAFVERDAEASAEWHLRAAEAGVIGAQYNMSVSYILGDGVDQDTAEGLKWIRRAAEAGHVLAQYNLGVFYEHGEHVDQNVEAATLWFQRAADQGHAAAEYAYGLALYFGKGTPSNPQRAFEYMNRAAAQEFVSAYKELSRMYYEGRAVERDESQSIFWARKLAETGDAEGQDILRRLSLDP